MLNGLLRDLYLDASVSAISAQMFDLKPVQTGTTKAAVLTEPVNKSESRTGLSHLSSTVDCTR